MKFLIGTILFLASFQTKAQMHQLSFGIGNSGWGYFPLSETLPAFELNYLFSYGYFSATLGENFSPLNNDELALMSSTKLLVGFQTNPQKLFILRMNTGARYCLIKLNNQALHQSVYTLVDRQMNFVSELSLGGKLNAQSSIFIGFDFTFLKHVEPRGVSGGKAIESNLALGCILSYAYTFKKK